MSGRRGHREGFLPHVAPPGSLPSLCRLSAVAIQSPRCDPLPQVVPPKRLLKRFGLVVRRHRDRVGIPQDELAHRAGLHRTYISLVERGQRNPTLQVIHALAGALNTTMTEMVEELERHKD